MARKTMPYKILPVDLSLLFGLLLFACSKPTDPGVSPGNAAIGLKDLYDTASFNGWLADSSNHFVSFNGAEFFQFADGGAQIYVDSGLVSATIKELTSTDSSKSCVITIMDFGTIAKSSGIFNVKVSKSQASKPITSFNPSQAVALSQYLGNILVYAHFYKYYFEIQLTGYSDAAQSIADAALILTKYKSIIL
jgi:hypothetical protein